MLGHPFVWPYGSRAGSAILSAPSLRSFTRYDLAAYLFKDQAGTVPVTANGDPIGCAKDLSGNGYHATQNEISAPAKRPTWDSSAKGASFDGVDDHLLLPMDTLGLGESGKTNEAFTVYIVGNCTSVAATRGLVGQYRSATATQFEWDGQFTPSNVDFLLRQNGGNSRLQYGSGGATGLHLWTFQRTSTNSYKTLKVYRDNVSVGSQVSTLGTYNVTTQAGFPLALGARSDQAASTAYWLGVIHACICCFAEHSTNVMTAIYNECKTIWTGIP